MQVFFVIGYIIVGLVQFFALMDGLEYATGLPSFLSFFVSSIVTYIPLVGSLLGVYGAVAVWDWNVLQALILFFWYVPLVVLFIVFDSVSSLYNKRA